MCGVLDWDVIKEKLAKLQEPIRGNSISAENYFGHIFSGLKFWTKFHRKYRMS
jgi:hypothetical protein